MNLFFRDISILDEDFKLREHCSVLIEGEYISEIGGNELEAPPGLRVISGEDLLLLPAFYNLHCHVPMTLLRGLGEGLPLDRWLTERVFPFEATLSEEDVYWGSLLGIAELLAGGAVSFTDMYFLEPGILSAVRETGIKANLAHGTGSSGDETFEQTNAFIGTEYLRKELARCKDGRVRAEASLHAEYTNDEAGIRSCLAYAKAHNLRMHVHLSESKSEHEACKARRGGLTPLAFFHSLGLLEQPCIFAHAIHLEDNDYQLLADAVAGGADISLVHNPSSNLKLASGMAPLKRWMESGVNVCIGTDGAASNNNLDMLEEIQLASFLQKGISGDPLFLEPAEAFRIASLNGAKAQGRSLCGQISKGNKADLVLMDLTAPRCQPVHDPLAAALYSANSGSVAMTICDGRILYERGQYNSLDIVRVVREVKRICKEKRAVLGL